jgi:hypothetical protein
MNIARMFARQYKLLIRANENAGSLIVFGEFNVKTRNADQSRLQGARNLLRRNAFWLQSPDSTACASRLLKSSLPTRFGYDRLGSWVDDRESVFGFMRVRNRERREFAMADWSSL